MWILFALLALLAAAGPSACRGALSEQYAFYAAYHRHPVNRGIHFACVWPILWSALALIHGKDHRAACFAGGFYAAYYLWVCPAATGAVAAALVGGGAAAFVRLLSPAGNLKVHVACWVAQLVGHAAFEGRAPALLDNLGQAAVTAPLFVLSELMGSAGQVEP